MQLRKWIRNLSALEQAAPTAKCLASSSRARSPVDPDSAASTCSPSPPYSPPRDAVYEVDHSMRRRLIAPSAGGAYNHFVAPPMPQLQAPMNAVQMQQLLNRAMPYGMAYPAFANPFLQSPQPQGWAGQYMPQYQQRPYTLPTAHVIHTQQPLPPPPVEKATQEAVNLAALELINMSTCA